MRAKEFILDHTIDNRKGAGATSYNADINYFGFTVKMLPSMFLKLAAAGGGDSAEGLAKFIADGGAVAAPMLYIKVPREWQEGDLDITRGIPNIHAHEGRNRMMAIRKLEGDIPVEVHILLRSSGVEWRARHLTPEIVAKVNGGVMNEQETAYIRGPLFV